MNKILIFLVALVTLGVVYLGMADLPAPSQSSSNAIDFATHTRWEAWSDGMLFSTVKVTGTMLILH